MSQTSPFGQPVDDASSERPPVPTTPAPAEKSSRAALLAIGATAIALVAAVAGYFLLSGGSDEYPTGVDSSFPQAGAPASTPTPSTSPTPLPTESTVNARNPFVNAPSPTTSAGATSAAAVATAPATAAPVMPAPNTPAPTITVEKTEVFVTLVKFDAGSKNATFRVISPTEVGQKGWAVKLGQNFGTPWSTSGDQPFKYDGTRLDKGSGTLCPTVKYVDAASTRVCKGEIVQVQ